MRPSFLCSILSGILSTGICLAVPAAAQAPISNLADLSASPLLSRFDSFSGTQTDVMFGHGVKGPYSLSWKGLMAGTETVERDGTRLIRDSDYQIDYAAGKITFTTPLMANSIARVTYTCDTVGATQNGVPLPSPLAYNLFQAGSNKLTIGTAYLPLTSGDPTTTAPDPVTTLQLKTGLHLNKSTDFMGALFLDSRGGDMLDHGAFALGEHTHTKLADLTLGFSRAGADFLQSQSNDVKAGIQSLKGQLALTPTKDLEIDSLAQTQDTVSAPGTGSLDTTTQELKHSLAYSPTGIKFQANHDVTTTHSSDGSGSKQVQNDLSLTRTLIKGTDATLKFGTTMALTTPAPGTPPPATPTPPDYQQTAGIDVTSTTLKQLKISGGYQNTLDSTGSTDTTSLQLQATPVAKVKALTVTGTLKDAIKPDGFQLQRGAIVTLPPVMNVALSGGVQQSTTAAKDVLTGILDAKAKLSRFVEVDGGARLRDANSIQINDPDALNTYNVSVALKPSDRVQLTGSMALNPVDGDGPVRRSTAQTLGIDTDLGLIHLRGKYGVENSYVDFKSNDLIDLGLDLHFSHADILSMGYQTRSSFDSSLTGSNIYTLGFTHHLSTLVDLSLNSSMTVSQINGIVQPDQSELKATANVGIKF
jgi:hypothetical protein